VANLNKIILVGKVSDDPEAKFTTEGTALTKFTIEVSRPKRADGVQETDSMNIVSWGKVAELAGEYLKKERLALVEGRIQIKALDQEEGKTKWVTEIVANNVTVLSASAGDIPSKAFEKAAEFDDEDIPF
jgi:single-strand DNA-binding protein